MRAGNVIIAIGTVVILIGVAVRFGLFSWFGRLPGDVRVEGERSSVFIPITSMLVVSVVGSILLSIVARFFRGQ